MRLEPKWNCFGNEVVGGCENEFKLTFQKSQSLCLVVISKGKLKALQSFFGSGKSEIYRGVRNGIQRVVKVSGERFTSQLISIACERLENNSEKLLMESMPLSCLHRFKSIFLI
jgi:hypothetical protein